MFLALQQHRSVYAIMRRKQTYPVIFNWKFSTAGTIAFTPQHVMWMGEDWQRKTRHEIQKNSAPVRVVFQPAANSSPAGNDIQ